IGCALLYLFLCFLKVPNFGLFFPILLLLLLLLSKEFEFEDEDEEFEDDDDDDDDGEEEEGFPPKNPPIFELHELSTFVEDTSSPFSLLIRPSNTVVAFGLLDSSMRHLSQSGLPFLST